MIGVLLVDDHPFVRAQIRELLSGADGIDVVGECADGSEVAGVAAATRPDVVLMDVQMPVMSGPTATRHLMTAQPSIRVLMMTGSMNPRILQESAQAGAVGFLLKGGDPTLLLTAIRTVADGGTAWPGSQPTEPGAAESCGPGGGGPASSDNPSERRRPRPGRSR